MMIHINTEEFNHSLFMPDTATHETIVDRLNQSLAIFDSPAFADFKPYRIQTQKIDCPQRVTIDGEVVAIASGTVFTVYAKKIKQ